MLEQHKKVLDHGIATLRDYIRATFTIDEVLYEGVKIEPAWFQ
jgi:hypothetical protein